MQISFQSGNYSIISSGQVFLFDSDKNLRIDFRADNEFEFSAVLTFKKDLCGEQKIDRSIDGNTIELTCFNFDDTGTGLTKPVKLARIEGKDVFLMFWSYLEGAENGKVRSVKYTVFMENSLEEHNNGK